MATQSRSRDRACSAVVAVCAVILPVMASAQDAAIDRIEAIERQMRGVQTELQRLKHELGEAKRQLRNRGARRNAHRTRLAKPRNERDNFRSRLQPPNPKEH